MNTASVIHTGCIDCEKLFTIQIPDGFLATTVIQYLPAATGNRCPECYRKHKAKEQKKEE